MGTMMGYLTVQTVDDTLSMELLGLRDPVVPVDMEPINNTKIQFRIKYFVNLTSLIIPKLNELK